MRAPGGSPNAISIEKVQQWYEARNRRDWSAVAELLSPQLVMEEVARRQMRHGIADYLAYVRGWIEIFPDLEFKLNHIVGTGRESELFVVEYSSVGHQSRAWGGFPPSRLQTRMRFCDLLRFEHEKIVNCKTYLDLYGPLCELGHVVSNGARLNAQNEGEAA